MNPFEIEMARLLAELDQLTAARDERLDDMPRQLAELTADFRQFIDRAVTEINELRRELGRPELDS